MSSKIPLLARDKKALSLLFSSLVNLSEFVELNFHSNMRCPFHDDVNKPSSKAFKDEEDDIERIWCWVCRKQYTSYDYVKQILNEDPLYFLIKNLGKDNLEKILETFDFETVNISLIDFKEYKDKSIIELVNIISGVIKCQKI